MTVFGGILKGSDVLFFNYFVIALCFSSLLSLYPNSNKKNMPTPLISDEYYDVCR
jgi:hypothetical protein